MQYLRQFMIIAAISLAGEALSHFVALPIPAGIYGIVLLFALLACGKLKVESFKDVSSFLLAVMPVMFIPAAVGLMDSFSLLSGSLAAYITITAVSTVAVMVISGLVTQHIIRCEERGKSTMHDFVSSSAFFGVFVSLAAYFIGLHLKKKTGLSIMNPLLIAVCLVIAVLSFFKIDYDAYNQSAKLLSSLLTPATICLAVPLYEQLALLRRHKKAILLGVLSGVITSLVCVLALSLLFGLDHTAYVTLLPKSITTAIGMGVSEELGGHVSITVAVIIITGILGNMIAKSVCRLFRITEPVARGVAIGTSSHAIGTTRAMELGEIEGAMSGLSIAVAGILTVLCAWPFSMLV